MGSKLVYWLTDSLLITGETLPESLSAQTRSTAADFLCLVTVSVYSGVPRVGSGSSSSSASHPTESSDSSELLSSPSSGAEAITRSQWEELASLNPFVCSASRSVMVRKSTPKRNHHFHQTCRLVFLARISDCCHSREHQFCHGESQTSYHFFWHESSHVTCKRVDVNCMSWALALHKNKSLCTKGNQRNCIENTRCNRWVFQNCPKLEFSLVLAELSFWPHHGILLLLFLFVCLFVCLFFF